MFGYQIKSIEERRPKHGSEVTGLSIVFVIKYSFQIILLTIRTLKMRFSAMNIVENKCLYGTLIYETIDVFDCVTIFFLATKLLDGSHYGFTSRISLQNI